MNASTAMELARVKASIVTLERLARDNREMAQRESESPHGIEAMRLYYLGKAQAYEIAVHTVKGEE